MKYGSILIVEDDQAIRESLAQALEEEGFDVLSAVNGQHALDIFSTMETPGMVLLDLMMPVMNGFEFLEARKQIPTLSDIPVVIFSAFPEKAKELEANAYLQKPLNLDDLFRAAKRYCIQFPSR